MLLSASLKEDKELIRNICVKLNELIKTIIYIDPNFIYLGSKEKGYYTIYNQNTHGKYVEFSLNFRLYYPNTNSSYEDNDILEDRLLYTKIEWFSVTPKGKGKGSEIIKSFISIIDDIEDMKYILLIPKNQKARNFWIKNNFIEEDYNLKLDKRLHDCASERLVYKLK